MFVREVKEFLDPESAAEDSANAIKSALLMEDGDARNDIIYRNAKHLELVLTGLNISDDKRAEYQKLIDDHLVK